MFRVGSTVEAASMTERVSLLAQRLKQLREAAGMTQQGLANAAGLSMAVVSQLEQGLRADPRTSTLVALAKALGVTVDALAVGPGEAPKKKRKKTSHRGSNGNAS
jgi:transcriptional regulator with XRE-family HTH domain